MAKVERIRDALTAPPEPGYWEQRRAAGWRLASIEWEREVEGQEEAGCVEEVPYGLRVSGDYRHLEEDPAEMRALILMMNSIVDDQPMSAVAEELNRHGIRTRSGTRWTGTDVFRMLPRLVEAGPRVFSNEEWRRRRQRLLKVV